MIEIFSHALAFSVLFVAAVWDLKTTEVPDTLGWIGVVGGISLHGFLSYSTGSLEPLVFSLGVGAIFSVYGWGSYLLGMWGGADAFAMSVLGFAAPYSISGTGFFHAASLFVNVMLVGFVYTLGFAVWKAVRSGGVFRKTWNRLMMEEKRVAAEILAAGVFSGVLLYFGGTGWAFFMALVALILLYRFLKVLEAEEMTREVKVSELEGGEVPATGQGLGHKVKGLTDEDIEAIEKESIQVRSGVRFVPAFPAALLLTDVFPKGFLWILLSLQL